MQSSNELMTQSDDRDYESHDSTPEKTVAEARLALMRLKALESAHTVRLTIFGLVISTGGFVAITVSLSWLLYTRDFASTIQAYIVLGILVSAAIVVLGVYSYFKRIEKGKFLVEANHMEQEIESLLNEIERYESEQKESSLNRA